jgi:hypothetical protein
MPTIPLVVFVPLFPRSCRLPGCPSPSGLWAGSGPCGALNKHEFRAGGKRDSNALIAVALRSEGKGREARNVKPSSGLWVISPTPAVAARWAAVPSCGGPPLSTGS